MTFTNTFKAHVSEGDYLTCEIEGYQCRATIRRDDDQTPPWKREDGYGPVSEWMPGGKRPGQRVLSRSGQVLRYYDFESAIKIALRDGWGTKDGKRQLETNAQYAARAVEEDFASLKAWCDDEWSYVGVCVTIKKKGIALTGKYDHALWGVDCNHPNGTNDYLVEVANELLPDALTAAKARLVELCGLGETKAQSNEALVAALRSLVAFDDDGRKNGYDSQIFLANVIMQARAALAKLES